MHHTQLIYRLDGHYELTDDFDASSFNESIPNFTGSINGNCHIVRNLKNCLIEVLAGNGTVQHLTINDANTANAKCAPAVVGTAKDSTTIKFIRIEKGFFKNTKTDNHLGSVAGLLLGNAKIENVIAEGSRLITSGAYSNTGGLVGRMADHSNIKNMTVTGLHLIARKKEIALGGIVGMMLDNAQAEHMVVIGTSLTADHEKTNIGGAVGSVHYLDYSEQKEVNIKDIICINVTINLHGEYSYAGGIIGLDIGPSDGIRMTSINVIMKSENSSSSDVGGGFGMIGYKSIFKDISCISSTIEGFGYVGGIVGYLLTTINDIKNMLVVNSDISVLSQTGSASGGIGLNFYSILENVAVSNSNVSGVNINPCSGAKSPDYGCTLAKGVVYQKDNNTDGIPSLYFTAGNMTDQCLWNDLPFVDGNCVINASALEKFSYSEICDYFYFYSQAETTAETIAETIAGAKADTNMIIILGATAGGVFVLALFTYCGIRFIQRLRQGDRGQYHSPSP